MTAVKVATAGQLNVVSDGTLSFLTRDNPFTSDRARRELRRHGLATARHTAQRHGRRGPIALANVDGGIEAAWEQDNAPGFDLHVARWSGTAWAGVGGVIGTGSISFFSISSCARDAALPACIMVLSSTALAASSTACRFRIC